MPSLVPATKSKMSTASKPLKIAIIGGGLGGLSLALGLYHQKVAFHIYEAAEAFSEIGAGIAFGANTIRALKLIDPAIEAGLRRCSTVSSVLEKDLYIRFEYLMDSRNGNGKQAGDHIVDVLSPGWGQQFVHRARFLEELVKLLPEGVASFRKTLESIEEMPEGVKLRFSDGVVVEADAVVGADGIRSHVRQSILGSDAAYAPRFAQEYAYRGLAPMDVAKGFLGEKAADAHLWMGYGKYCICYPVDGGKVLNLVAAKRCEEDWIDKEWKVETTQEQMMEDFGDTMDDMKNFIHAVAKPVKWALFDMPQLPYFQKDGKIVLLGDSAHASTPHQGAGASMAIEDGYVLSQLLGEAKSTAELRAVFRAYERVRKPRTERLVSTSAQAGRIEMLMEGGVGDDLEKCRANLQARWRWIWDIDLEDHVADAKRHMISFLNLEKS